MATLLAVCPNCPTVFPTGLEKVSESAIIIKSNKWAPCPNCGSIGEIPDETYKSNGNDY